MSKMDEWFRKHPRTKTARTADPSNNLFLFRNGHVMAVLRPESAAVKLAQLESLKDGKMTEAQFDALLNDQPHQFIGYALRTQPNGNGKMNIGDGWGKAIDEVQPGDSFVACGHGTPLEPPKFMQTGVCHVELWDDEEVVVMPTPDLKGDSNTGVVIRSKNGHNGAIVTRAGITEPDCHLPTLNKIITGDPERHWSRPDKAADRKVSTRKEPTK